MRKLYLSPLETRDNMTLLIIQNPQVNYYTKHELQREQTSS